MTLRAALLCLLALLQPMAARAHALDPGYLELSAMGGDRWRVTWRMPDVDGRPMAITPALPAHCTAEPAPPPHFDGRGWSTVSLAACPGGLAGGQIRIEGLANTRTDTLVRYETAPGMALTQRLTAASPAFTVPRDPGHFEVFTSYVALGVTHILEGVDHLLFVLVLLLLVRDPRRLFWAVSAFTLAHSITLACATMGWLDLPSAPVEVVIALSIVFLAWELAKPVGRRDPLAQRFPALVSFGFGLVHGLGFAGALREIGLPRGDIPMALLSFNIGVEAGQLVFIGAVLALGAAARRPFAAILVGPDSTVIMTQHNAFNPDHDMTGHAERVLMTRSSTSFEPAFLRECTMYTSAEPCAMCAGAADWAGVKAVVYGLSEHRLKSMTGDHPENPTLDLSCRAVFSAGQRPVEVVGPLLEDEAAEVYEGVWR